MTDQEHGMYDVWQREPELMVHELNTPSSYLERVLLWMAHNAHGGPYELQGGPSTLSKSLRWDPITIVPCGPLLIAHGPPEPFTVTQTFKSYGPPKRYVWTGHSYPSAVVEFHYPPPANPFKALLRVRSGFSCTHLRSTTVLHLKHDSKPFTPKEASAYCGKMLNHVFRDLRNRELKHISASRGLQRIHGEEFE